MTAFDYCLISLNLFALAWVAYQLYSTGNDNKIMHSQLEAKLNRIEQILSSEFGNSKSSFTKISNKLDGATNKLDNIKRGLTGIELKINSTHDEEQRLIKSNNEYVSRVNSQLVQNFQTATSKFKNITLSINSLNQLLRDVIDKVNQVGYRVDSISTIQINNQKNLIEKIDKNIKSEEIGFQQVRSIIVSLQNEIKDQENLLKPFESLILELTELYISLEQIINNIHKEEEALSKMANKHEDLIDCVRKLNKTSIDVFEILKLYIPVG